MQVTHPQPKVDIILSRLFASRPILIRVVRYLLDDLRADRARQLDENEGMEVDQQETEVAETGSSASDGRPVTPGDDQGTRPLTLLDIIDQSQSPGCKRKRSNTHIGSIAIASILPPSSPFSPTASPEVVVRVAGRPVATRKRVGLGRLFSGLGMGGGSHGGASGSSGAESVSEYSDSESEDEDLIVIV